MPDLNEDRREWKEEDWKINSILAEKALYQAHEAIKTAIKEHDDRDCIECAKDVPDCKFIQRVRDYRPDFIGEKG